MRDSLRRLLVRRKVRGVTSVSSPFSEEFRLAGSRLLQQQCWCWGCDIRRPAGNLLLVYGFERRRPPEGVSGNSHYTYRLSPTTSIRLWGFGFFFRVQGSPALYVNRYEFQPRLAASDCLPDGLFHPEQIPPTIIPEEPEGARLAHWMLSRALLWIGAYEQWVLETIGVEYRAGCLRQWEKPSVEPREVPQRWRDLAAALADGPVAAG